MAQGRAGCSPVGCRVGRGAGALGARGAKKRRPRLGRGALQNFVFKTDHVFVGVKPAFLRVSGCGLCHCTSRQMWHYFKQDPTLVGWGLTARQRAGTLGRCGLMTCAGREWPSSSAPLTRGSESCTLTLTIKTANIAITSWNP